MQLPGNVKSDIMSPEFDNVNTFHIASTFMWDNIRICILLNSVVSAYVVFGVIFSIKYLKKKKNRMKIRAI